MVPRQNRNRRRASRPTGLRGLIVAAVLPLLVGCSYDSFMDPSIVGRWEMTPTIVPILERIAPIEPADGGEVEYSDVRPEDLVPEISAYRIGPGDILEIVVYDLFVRNAPDRFERQVDRRGYVDVPQIGEVYTDGLTREQLQDALIARIRARGLLDDPIVSVVVLAQRNLTYTVIGAVSRADSFLISKADFRLLEALATAGSFNEQADFVYIIRQVGLTAEAAGETTDTQSPTAPDRSRDPEAGEDLLRIIDELGEPPAGNPAVMQPSDRGRPPAIGLPDDDAPIATPERRAPVEQTSAAGDGPGGAAWRYIDGRWRLVRRAPRPPSTTEIADGAGPELDQLVTQRVIRVPVKPLLAGDARFNIVIRPGDIIRVPPQDSGTVFIAGQVSRPGAIQLAPGLTLTRAIDSVGGLSGLAVPERVDLVRMVGATRQATIRLNLRAIEEGTQPDVFIKDNDRINVGTNFWALPLAVVRGGFRASYGFGFLLDRNFANDIFGPPPVDRGF